MTLDLTTGSSLVQAMGAAVTALSEVREMVRGAKDRETRKAFADIEEQLLEIRGGALRLDEENRTLRAKLAEREVMIGPVLPFGYYFLTTDKDKASPFCPECWQSKGHKYPLFAESSDDGCLRRYCRTTDCYYDSRESRARTDRMSATGRPHTFYR